MYAYASMKQMQACPNPYSALSIRKSAVLIQWLIPAEISASPVALPGRPISAQRPAKA